MVPDAEIDAAVNEIEYPSFDRRIRSRTVDPDTRRIRCCVRLAQGRQIALCQREADTNGLELSDRHKPCRVVDAHEIAGCHTNGAHAPGDRRLELRVSQFQSVGLQDGLVGLHCLLGCFEDSCRLVQLLSWSNILLDQLLFAAQVGPSLSQSRVVLRKLGLVASYQCLDLAVVQREQEVAFLDDLSVENVLLEHQAVDTRLHHHDRRRLHDADGASLDAEVLKRDLCRYHRHDTIARPLGAGAFRTRVHHTRRGGTAGAVDDHAQHEHANDHGDAGKALPVQLSPLEPERGLLDSAKLETHPSTSSSVMPPDKPSPFLRWRVRAAISADPYGSVAFCRDPDVASIRSDGPDGFDATPRGPQV